MLHSSETRRGIFAQTKGRALVIAAFTALALPLSAMAQSDDDLVLVPLVPPKPADFVGTWNYQTSQPSVAGRCPAGTPLAGQIEISYDESATTDPTKVTSGPVTIDILSGSVCKPAAMCHLGGMISGTAVIAGTFAVADDEGGQAAQAWTLYFTSETSGAGSAIANYTHPSGFACNWAMGLTLTRPEPK